MAPEHFPLELHMLKKTRLNFQNELFQKKSNQGGGGKGNTFLKNLEFSGLSHFTLERSRKQRIHLQIYATPLGLWFLQFFTCVFFIWEFRK